MLYDLFCCCVHVVVANILESNLLILFRPQSVEIERKILFLSLPVLDEKSHPKRDHYRDPRAKSIIEDVFLRQAINVKTESDKRKRSHIGCELNDEPKIKSMLDTEVESDVSDRSQAIFVLGLLKYETA